MASKHPLQGDVYLDANFLIAYFVPHHPHAKKAGKIFAKLLINKNKLNLTALTLDECFNGIVFTLRNQIGNNSFPHAKFFDYLKQVLSTLLSNKKITIRQYEKSLQDGSINALHNIKNYTLKPRDAFHLSYMQDLGITYIVSFDSHFDKVRIISVINS